MTPYYRRDQADGITPPNLADASTYAEHIVHARGKRTRFTSLSSDPATIVDFGPQLWQLLQPKIYDDGHGVISHDALVSTLREETRASLDPAARELASRALPRAVKRREALVHWNFDVSRIARKELSEWARPHVRHYFVKA
ncbi:hypothetical protein WMF45_21645 [Sorangium sp. So ce448]|uniref:hypothetical protein n=1 Tax=Sorangium sp. So ce448 TaxID=3133314 RepID=UPI003F609144